MIEIEDLFLYKLLSINISNSVYLVLITEIVKEIPVCLKIDMK